MFEDKRSKRVLLVAHCVLNQNAKIDRCAHYPGAIQEAAVALIESGVGIIQMPCPELLYLGLDRQAERGASTTIESEDTRVAQRMVEEQGQALCQEIVHDLVYQIEEYRHNGFEVIGIVGINGSPTCGVEISWSNGRAASGPGVFIQLLEEECHRRAIDVPMRGIRAYEPAAAVSVISELCRPDSGLSAEV